MAQPLSYEDKEMVYLITSRTIGSKLWFVNNKQLELMILSFLAKYVYLYGAVIYGFILMGNHYHMLIKFPRMNRARFMRSFNAMVAKLVGEHVPNFDQGKLWARRYSFQAVPRPEDILHWFQYLTLNPVSSGLCTNPADYKGYNSYEDSINENVKTFRVFERMRYNDRVRFNSKIKKEDFIKEYELRYERLPGFETKSQQEYISEIRERQEIRRLEMIAERKSNKQGFATQEILNGLKAGTKPKNTKKSSRHSFRPLVLTLCNETKTKFLEKYFDLLEKFQEASLNFRQGVKDVIFPEGTYAPSLVAVT